MLFLDPFFTFPTFLQWFCDNKTADVESVDTGAHLAVLQQAGETVEGQERLKASDVGEQYKER